MTRFKRAAGDTFRSLRYRNFRLFFGGQLVSQVGNWLTMIAQTLLVLYLTGNGLAVGLLVACQFLPVLAFGAFTGLIADRSDKRKLLLIVQVFAMLQSFTLAALAFMDNPPLVAIYVVAFAGGIATAFDNPARRAFVVEMVPPEDVQNAVSMNSAIMTSARVFGPALAGLLSATVGYGWCFTLDGLSYIAVIVALWKINSAELRPAPVTERRKGQVREGLRYAHSQPDLWIPLVMMGAIGLLAFNFQVVMPLFVTRSLGGGDGMYTVLYSVLSIGSLIGALATARRATVEVSNVIVGAVVFGVSMVLLALVPSLLLAFPAGLLMGFASMVFMTQSTAIVQVRSDATMRGRVLALQAIVFLGSTPIGGPILGWICDAWGARAGLLVGGVSCFVAVAWGVFALRRMEERKAAGAAVDDESLDVAADPRLSRA